MPIKEIQCSITFSNIYLSCNLELQQEGSVNPINYFLFQEGEHHRILPTVYGHGKPVSNLVILYESPALEGRDRARLAQDSAQNNACGMRSKSKRNKEILYWKVSWTPFNLRDKPHCWSHRYAVKSDKTDRLCRTIKKNIKFCNWSDISELKLNWICSLNWTNSIIC